MLATTIKCDRCDDPAMVHATERRDGGFVETHLCRAHVQALHPMLQVEKGFPPLRMKRNRIPSGDPVCGTCGASADVMVCEWVNPKKIRSRQAVCAVCARAEGMKWQPVAADEVAVVIEGWAESIEWDENLEEGD